MNEYDTNRIYDIVRDIGYTKTNDHLNADCYLLNTCHIRDKSKEKVFDEIGRVRKNYINKKTDCSYSRLLHKLKVVKWLRENHI